MTTDCDKFPSLAKRVFENADYEVRESDLFSAKSLVCLSMKDASLLGVVLIPESTPCPSAKEAHAILGKASAAFIFNVQLISMAPLSPELIEFAKRSPRLSLVDRETFVGVAATLPPEPTAEEKAAAKAKAEAAASHHSEPSGILSKIKSWKKPKAAKR